MADPCYTCPVDPVRRIQLFGFSNTGGRSGSPFREKKDFKEADTISMLPKGEDEMLVQYIEENLGGKIPAIYQESLGRVQIADEDSPAS